MPRLELHPNFLGWRIVELILYRKTPLSLGKGEAWGKDVGLRLLSGLLVTLNHADRQTAFCMQSKQQKARLPR